MSLSEYDRRRRALDTDPLEVVEEAGLSQNWQVQRPEADEVVFEVKGSWGHYSLHFVWQEEFSALQLCCPYEFAIPAHRIEAIQLLLARINEKLWLGHFDLSPEDPTPMFRHNSLMRGNSPITMEYVLDLADIAIAECERFYPAFHFMIATDLNADEALAASILSPVGEA